MSATVLVATAAPHPRGLLDTSVIVALERIRLEALPAELQ